MQLPPTFIIGVTFLGSSEFLRSHGVGASLPVPTMHIERTSSGEGVSGPLLFVECVFKDRRSALPRQIGKCKITLADGSLWSGYKSLCNDSSNKRKRYSASVLNDSSVLGPSCSFHVPLIARGNDVEGMNVDSMSALHVPQRE